MMYLLPSLQESFINQDLLKIIFSILAGACLGAEREFRSKSAGLRTLILISLASTLFTIVSIYLGGKNNPDRIASNILTGIGFLGAGVIFKEENRVSGLTTAVTIWVVSAIGMCIGLGYFSLASEGTILAFVVLFGFSKIQVWIDQFSQIRIYSITLPMDSNIELDFEKKTKEFNLTTINQKLGKSQNQKIIKWTIKGHQMNQDRWVQSLLADSRILEFSY
jgi:putative Mg2+ transporter-C (MgtC) family protein